MARAPRKAVAEKEEKLPVAAIDFGADAGGGMEGTDRESFAIPFLRVLQKQSPQVDEDDPAHVEGAKPGMLINTVTNELFDGDEGVLVLPCAYQRRFLRWAPRGSDEGFKGEFTVEQVREMESDGEVQTIERKLYAVQGDETNPEKLDKFSDTRSHFVILLTDDGPQQALLALSSTQIRKSKQLMSMLSNARIEGKQPPTWMSKIRVTTVREQNDEGTWYGVKFTAEGFLDDRELYDAGKAFYETIKAGEARVDYAKKEEDGQF